MQSNTLSVVLRDAWDHGNLQVITKHTPERATEAHISVIAHVTAEELLRELTDTEQVNGFEIASCSSLSVARSGCRTAPRSPRTSPPSWWTS
jgi:hypothetical protein